MTPFVFSGEHADLLRYEGVAHVSLFGSVWARDAASNNSDV